MEELRFDSMDGNFGLSIPMVIDKRNLARPENELAMVTSFKVMMTTGTQQGR